MESPRRCRKRLRLLRRKNWSRIELRLLQFALGCFFRRGIPAAGAVRGVSVADVVHDAIEAVWSGRRTWDFATVPLMIFLKNSVRSEISNLFDLGDVRLVDGWPPPGVEADEDPPEDAMQQNHDHPLARRPRTPEEITAEKQHVDICYDLLLEAARGDHELVRYLYTLLAKGIETPKEIAKDWNVNVKDIYRLENRLRRRVKKLLEWRQVKKLLE